MRNIYFPLTKEEAMAISEDEFEKMCVPDERVMIPFKNGVLADCNIDSLMQYLLFRYENAMEFFELEFGARGVKDIKNRILKIVVNLGESDIDIYTALPLIDSSLVIMLLAKRAAREKYTARKYQKGA